MQLIVLRSDLFYGLENLREGDTETTEHSLCDEGLRLAIEQLFRIMQYLCASHDTLRRGDGYLLKMRDMLTQPQILLNIDEFKSQLLVERHEVG